ncbi:hypothetical protein, partial [Candidatus Accumulibacter vicinus]|uniref:hypothetical protein n=1 Tax=Candidatus Accumulibacter vicinus TaxID=2954382 RepID=UPI00235B5B55
MHHDVEAGLFIGHCDRRQRRLALHGRLRPSWSGFLSHRLTFLLRGTFQRGQTTPGNGSKLA